MEFFFTTILLLAILLSLTIITATVSGILKIFGCPFKKNFLRGLWILTLPPLFFLYGWLVERNLTQTRCVEITSTRIPRSFDGYRIVQISDIHLRSFIGREKRLAGIVDKINALHPDAILFTGDLVSLRTSELDTTEKILGRLQATDGVYSVLGNHDYSFYAQWSDEKERKKDAASLIARQRAIGWDVLLNESRNITRNVSDTISIIGVENTSVRRKFRTFGNLDKAMQSANGSFKILMSHDPSHWRAEVAGKKDIDLTLSGHTHSMQYSLFGWSIISHIYKEYNGLYRDNGQYLYVNIGLGETMFPVRIGAMPEITVITLKNGDTAPSHASVTE